MANRPANSRTKAGLEPEQNGEGTREENFLVNLFEENGRRIRLRNYTPPKSDQKFSADYSYFGLTVRIGELNVARIP